MAAGVFGQYINLKSGGEIRCFGMISDGNPYMLVIISETCTKKGTPAGMFSARKNRKAQFHNGLISECKLSGGNIGQLFCVQISAFRSDRQFFQQTILI